MVAKGLLGNKSRQGFFKKVKRKRAARNFSTTIIQPVSMHRRSVPKFASIEAAKSIDDPGKRLQAVIYG